MMGNWKRAVIILTSIACGSLILMVAVGVALDRGAAIIGGKIGTVENFMFALVVAIVMNRWAWLAGFSKKEKPNIIFFGLTCYLPGELIWYGYKEYYYAPKDKQYKTSVVAFALIGSLWLIVSIISLIVGVFLMGKS